MQDSETKMVPKVNIRGVRNAKTGQGTISSSEETGVRQNIEIREGKNQ